MKKIIITILALSMVGNVYSAKRRSRSRITTPDKMNLVLANQETIINTLLQITNRLDNLELSMKATKRRNERIARLLALTVDLSGDINEERDFLKKIKSKNKDGES